MTHTPMARISGRTRMGGMTVLLLVLAGLCLLPAGVVGQIPLSSMLTVHAGGDDPGGLDAAETILQQAASSMELGQGPSGGIPGRCAVNNGGEVVCQQASESTGTEGTSASRPAPEKGPPQWFNITANVSAHSNKLLPSVYEFGRMAYDASLSELVLFDGCSYTPVGSCLAANATWTYNGISWTNWTGSFRSAHAPSPSPRVLEGMDYDPALGGVVLFGGSEYIDSGWISLNDTWLFNGTSTVPRWTNITATVGYPHQSDGGPVSWTAGALAFDPALNELVAVDGCSDLALGGCTSVWNDTWFLNATTGWSAAAAAPGGPSTHLWGSSAAYDESNGDLVLFGGNDVGESAASNFTYLLNASGDWKNITSDDAGCVGSTCFTPPPRQLSAMTWDGQLGAVFLTGGTDPGTNSNFNDSWLFSNGTWLPANLTGLPAPAGYDAVALPAMPETSDPLAPVIIGGSGPCSPGCATNEWVYEVPPEPSVTASPLIGDAQMPIYFNATLTPGSGSGTAGNWNVSFGDGFSSVPGRARGVDENISVPETYAVNHSYAIPGTYEPTVSWTDFYYIVETSSSPPVTLNPVITATINATADTIIVGGTDRFSPYVTGGTPPYTYYWLFGNGNNSTVVDPSPQLYSTTGTPKVTLKVTDAVDRVADGKLFLAVDPKPPPPFSLSGYDIVAIAIVAGVVVGMAVFLTRRKKPSPTPTPPRSRGATSGGDPSTSGPRPRPANPRGPPPGAGG